MNAAPDGAAIVRDAFDAYREGFRAFTARARAHFEAGGLARGAARLGRAARPLRRLPRTEPSRSLREQAGGPLPRPRPVAGGQQGLRARAPRAAGRGAGGDVLQLRHPPRVRDRGRRPRGRVRAPRRHGAPAHPLRRRDRVCPRRQDTAGPRGPPARPPPLRLRLRGPGPRRDAHRARARRAPTPRRSRRSRPPGRSSSATRAPTSSGARGARAGGQPPGRDRPRRTRAGGSRRTRCC